MFLYKTEKHDDVHNHNHSLLGSGPSMSIYVIFLTDHQGRSQDFYLGGG